MSEATTTSMTRARRYGGISRALLRPNQARSLQPGVSGFLFSVNPQHADRAKRELLALLSSYLDRVLNDDAPEVDTEEPPAQRLPRAEAANAAGVASGLAEELAAGATAGARGARNSFHPLLREVDTKVKGYLFISVSLPDGDSRMPPDEESAEAPPADGVVDPRTVVPEENSLVAAVADAMWMDLATRPRAVARYSFRCFPCGCSCVPTRPDLIAECAHRMAVSWYRESVLDDETRPKPVLPAAVWVSVIVRNNSNIDAVKDTIRLSVARALPKETFLVQPIYVANAAAAFAAAGRPTLQIAVLVMHSVALVALQPWAESRFDYNLNAVSEKALALNDMTVGASVSRAGDDTVGN